MIRRILKKHDPIKITKEDEDRILNEIPDMGPGFKQGMKFPEYFPAYEFFALDEGGRLIVRRPIPALDWSSFIRGKGYSP